LFPLGSPVVFNFHGYTAAIGVLRLPDVLCRSHAVAKALALGIFLMLLGLWVYQGEKQTALKILLAIFFSW
jgi:multicomponent Na+:H+ antiporter subunit G